MHPYSLPPTRPKAEQNPFLKPNDFEHDLSMTAQVLSDLRPRDLPPDTLLGWDNWLPMREDIKRRVLSILGEFPERPEELNAKWGESEETEHYTRHEVVYDGEPGELITAIILIPKGLRGPAPAVLCPHPTNKNGRRAGTIPGIAANKDGTPRDSYQYAWELAARGFITLVWDHFTLGPRNPDGEPFDSRVWERLHPEWSVMGKIAWDVMRATDFLCSLEIVDSERIGCIGMSLGGHTALFGPAFDDRILACVPVSGFSTFRSDRNVRHIWVRDNGEGNFHYMPRLAEYLDRGEAPPFDLHEVSALVAPRPQMIISGYHDEYGHGNAVMGEYTARLHDLYEHLGLAEGFAHVHHGERHLFSKLWREVSYLWLENWLKR